MSTHSQELDKSFEKYRESASYEKEVENRMEVLSKFQFKPEFMDKLARFSVDT
jgi:hypothetical protein